MSTTRQNKVSRLLQKELAEFFQREGSNRFTKGMITVTMVRISPDLGYAKVYLSFFPPSEAAKALVLVKDHAAEIRRSIGEKVRHQLRIIPVFEYFVDDSLDYADRIEQLLKK